MLPPHIVKSDKKEREKTAYETILFLINVDLKGFFLRDFGMELFLLNKNSITIETDEFLIGGPQIKPVGRTSTDRAPRQKPFGPTVPGDSNQKSQK